MYAHVTNDVIDYVGEPPQLYLDPAKGWQDWRSPAIRVPATFAPYGWLKVTENPKPPDTAIDIYEYNLQMFNGVPTQVWAPRTKTPEEVAIDTSFKNQKTIEDALAASLDSMQAILDATAATINAGPAPYIKDLARANKRMIRLLTKRLDSAN